MRTRARGPESFPIVYCILWPLYNGNLSTPNYDTVVTPNGQNQYKFPWKRRVSTYWCKRVEKYLLVLKILAISIHSTTFQGLSVFKERSTFNHMACGDGNGLHITGCTLHIKDTSLFRTLQRGPVVSVIQRFHCMCIVYWLGGGGDLLLAAWL